MGMFYGFGWIVLVLFYIALYRDFKKHGKGFLKSISITLLATLPFTYDIAITNALSGYYCLTTPSTYINKKVEYPESIYWEDNVYPGFSQGDRELMIVNYLDGIHLKTMALNGNDGKIYVYNLEKPIYKKFIENYLADNPQINIGNTEVYEAYAKEVMKSEKVYTKQIMPKMNYTVTFNEVKLNSFSSKFLYSDVTKVIDNKTDEVVAYNRRYMRFFYNIEYDYTFGHIYYLKKTICENRSLKLEYEIFNAYAWSEIHLGSHSRDLDEILINRYIKGKK